MIYNSPKRKWVKKIIIKRENDVILIFARKNEVVPQPNGQGPTSLTKF